MDLDFILPKLIRFLVPGVMGLIGIFIYLLTQNKKKGEKIEESEFDFMPGPDIEADFSKVDLSTYKWVELDKNKIPINLRDLQQYAEKWGIGDDGYRRDLIEHTSRKDIKKLNKVMKDRYGDINKWLGTLKGSLSEEAAAYLYLMEADEESGYDLRNREK
jgi:hypothetical protein